MAGDEENIGIIAESSGLHIGHRAPSARLLVRLTYAIQDDHRPTTPVSGDLPSTKATSTLGTSAVASLPPTKHSESPSVPIEDGEVANKQASIETLVTRLRRKEAKEANKQRASKMHAAKAIAGAASKANIEENTRGIAKEEGVTMSEIGFRCGKGLKGGKTGISGKTGR